jgi:hypothetical protein
VGTDKDAAPRPAGVRRPPHVTVGVVHRTHELPFVDASLTYAGGLLWATPRGGLMLGLDPSSLSIAARFTSGSARFVVAGGQHVGDVNYGKVVALDIGTGAVAWRRDGYVQGAMQGGFLVSTSRTLERVAFDGTSTVLARDETSMSPLQGAVAGELVWVIVGRELVGVTEDGVQQRRIVLPAGRAIPFVGPDGLLLAIDVETGDGPRCRLARVASDGLEEFAEIEGEARAAIATGGLVLLRLADGGCVVLQGEHRVRISAAVDACVCGERIAVLQAGAVIVVSQGDGVHAPTVSRAALPDHATYGSIAGSETDIFASSGPRLFVIDPTRLVPGDQAMTYATADGATGAEPIPAQVVFAGPSLVMVNHPRLGRLNLDRSQCAAPLAKGDAVVLDAVKELMPGKWRVEAWHRAGDAASQPATTGVLEAGTDHLLPLFADVQDVHRPVRPVASAALQRVDVPLDGLLDHLLRCFDEEPLLRRWLDRLSILIDITGGSTTGMPGTDPCLLGIAGNGGGDTVSLYIYPPAIAAGLAPPVVDFWHETGEITHLAADFDTWLADRLRDDDDDVASLVRARLGELPPTRPPGEAAPWFVAVHGEGPETDPRAIAELLERDPLAAERLLVRRLRERPEDTEVARDLAAVYGRLGWSWHRENLLANLEE